MNAPEVIAHLARLQMDVVTAQREAERAYKRDQAAVPNRLLDGPATIRTRHEYRRVVNERDVFLDAIRHHELEQAHNSETCPLCTADQWRPAPIDTRCPACNAAPGSPCTAPTDTSRRPVGWIHSAREGR
jgi:hypothetical protein